MCAFQNDAAQKLPRMDSALGVLRDGAGVKLFSFADLRPLEKTFGRQQAGSLLGKFFHDLC